MMLLSLALPLSMAMAQGKGKGAEKSVEVRSENNARWIQKKTNATEDQYNKIKAANTTYFTAIRDLKGKTNLSKDQKKAEIQRLKNERDASLKSILTADQWTTLEKSRNEAKEKKSKEKSKKDKKKKEGKSKSKDKKDKVKKDDSSSDDEDEELDED